MCFVSTKNCAQLLAVTRKVIDDLSHSLHRPVITEAGTQIPVITDIRLSRWNLEKANWNKFSKFRERLRM